MSIREGLAEGSGQGRLANEEGKCQREGSHKGSTTIKAAVQHSARSVPVKVGRSSDALALKGRQGLAATMLPVSHCLKLLTSSGRYQRPSSDLLQLLWDSKRLR